MILLKTLFFSHLGYTVNNFEDVAETFCNVAEALGDVPGAFVNVVDAAKCIEDGVKWKWNFRKL